MAVPADADGPPATVLRTGADGSLSFAGGGISVHAFFPGWAVARVSPDAAAAEADAAHIAGPDAGRPFSVIRRRDGAAFFRQG